MRALPGGCVTGVCGYKCCRMSKASTQDACAPRGVYSQVCGTIKDAWMSLASRACGLGTKLYIVEQVPHLLFLRFQVIDGRLLRLDFYRNPLHNIDSGRAQG